MDFQTIILKLQKFWADQKCIMAQPYDIEKGAGTMNPSTFLRVLGPEPWRVAYVEPSRRPADGRYGDNPNALLRITGNPPPWAHGAWAGRFGWMVWKSPSSPISNRLAALMLSL